MEVRCCIAVEARRNGAGLSARSRRIDVLVLEKHAGFLRDFRGTRFIVDAQLMYELGVLDIPAPSASGTA
jgi:hypothetical protein